MKFKITIEDPNGAHTTWVGDPPFNYLLRALEKREIKSFKVSHLPLKK